MAKPWERQEGETDKAFRAFCAYRDLGEDRSIAKAAAELGYKDPRPCETWSAKHGWVQRVSDWQDHQDSLALRELERQRIRMRLRHAEVGRDLIELCQAKAKLALANAKDPAALKELTLGVIPQLLSAAANLERLAIGEPTEIRESRGVERGLVLPMSLPDEDREEIVERMRRAGTLPGVSTGEGRDDA